MKIHQICLALLFVSAAGSRASGIDFTPHQEERQEDGFTMREIYLTAEPKLRYYLSLPPGWNARGSADSLYLAPTDRPFTSCRFGVSPFVPSRPPFSGDALEVYRRQARSGVPTEAEKTSIISETPDFFTLFNWTDYEITLSYELHGRELYQSVMFVNINANEQMQIILTAERLHYPALRAAILRTLTSWRRYLVPQ